MGEVVELKIIHRSNIKSEVGRIVRRIFSSGMNITEYQMRFLVQMRNRTECTQKQWDWLCALADNARMMRANSPFGQATLAAQKAAGRLPPS